MPLSRPRREPSAARLVAGALVGLAVLTGAASARAQDLKDRFNARLILTGMYLGETQTATVPENNEASPFHLAYGDLRLVLDGRRLPGRVDLHFDGRVRLTGEFDTNAAYTGMDQYTSRGYLGGREYELRQAWLLRRGDSFDFGLGRMVVAEADALRLDGARLWWRFHDHWSASLFGGAHPDPYSRSLTADYAATFAFAGGADAAYTYDKWWGSLSAVGTYLTGNDDGGPLPPLMTDPAAMVTTLPPMVMGTPRTEPARVFVTWTNYLRPLPWLDLFHDVVVDVAGAAGAQLTRLDALASARLGPLTLRLGYDHLSALAIEMSLTRLLAARGDYQAKTIENNLVVNRTARDEGRLQADLTLGKVSVYGEGRLRRRAIVELGEDPQFVAAGQQVAPGAAYDGTVGIRDRGTLGGLRAGLAATYLVDYRATTLLIDAEVGRSFLDDRISLDALFLYATGTDAQAKVACPQWSLGMPPTLPGALQSCFGNLTSNQYEIGLTASAALGKSWFVLADYRLVVDAADGPYQAILTNVVLLRLEARK